MSAILDHALYFLYFHWLCNAARAQTLKFGHKDRICLTQIHKFSLVKLNLLMASGDFETWQV